MGRTSTNKHRIVRRSATPIVACCLALLAAAPAMATKGRTARASVALPPESSRSVTATCPAGTHSTAGGFTVNPLGTPGLGFASVTQVSNRIGRRAWTVTSGAESSNPPATLTSVVRCERRIDSRIVVPLVGSATINPGFAQTFNFNCPPQTRPVSGAWSVNNPFNGDLQNSSNLVVIQNRRLDRNTWTMTAGVRSDPNGPNPPNHPGSTFTATVPCETVTRRRLVQRTTIDPFADDQRASATATCRKRTHVVSGGFVINPLPPGDVPFAPIDFNAPTSPRSWRVDLYDTIYGLPPGSSLTTYAYCRRNKLRRKRRSARRSRAAAAAPATPGWVEAQPPVPISG